MATKIEIIETGTTRIRRKAFTQKPGNGLLRRIRFLTNGELGERIPIYCFLISHPEGNILFDTGESPKAVEPGYYPWYHIGQYIGQLTISPDESLLERLKGLEINPQTDIKSVVLSHLHSDHTGGIPDIFGAAPIYASQEHWDAFRNPFMATIEGANPKAWPKGFKPTILKPTGPAIGPWERSYPVTTDGKVVAVDTPGHVPGHLSLIVYAEDVIYLLVGDATYEQSLLDAEQPDGITAESYTAVESLRRIKRFCLRNEVVVLPAHEFDAVRRLKEKDAYRPSPLR
jgi:glyoxylase-like metal-dependent hydrolase (beta-lactamase superfamily II)